VEIRPLRVFVTVAEAASFTAASEQLAITQPAVSQTIAQLERRVRAKLFERGQQKVRLTGVGRRLLPYARRVLHTLDEAMDTFRNDITTIRIGFHYAAAGTSTVPIVREFERSHPDTVLRLMRFDDQAAGLLDGRSHLSFLRNDFRDDRIVSQTICTEDRLAVVPVDHPLACRAEVALADLRRYPLVIVPAAGSTTPELWKPLPPRRVIEASNIDEWLEAVSLDRGIGVTSASTARFRVHPNVRFLPISDAPPVEVRIAWPRASSHPLSAALVDIARRAMSAPTASEASG
jgi:DNA-binding transcriptional LysR family regulator